MYRYGNILLKINKIYTFVIEYLEEILYYVKEWQSKVMWKKSEAINIGSIRSLKIVEFSLRTGYVDVGIITK